MEHFEQTYISELPAASSLVEVTEEKRLYGNDRDEQKPSPLEKTDLPAFFRTGGALAAAMDDYELRPGQLEMAEVVKRAILEERPA